jgi:hypothetical protein
METLRKFLKDQEWLECNSPKSCFRPAFETGLVSERICLAPCRMTGRRNNTSHTCIEAVADRIYQARREHCRLLSDLRARMKSRLK